MILEGIKNCRSLDIFVATDEVMLSTESDDDKLASEGGTSFVYVFPPRRLLNFDKFMRQPRDAVRLNARDEINSCTPHKGQPFVDRKICDGRAW